MGLRLAPILIAVALTACAGSAIYDAGCAKYGELRRDRPTLGADAVSQWVARLDSAMTGACRG